MCYAAAPLLFRIFIPGHAKVWGCKVWCCTPAGTGWSNRSSSLGGLVGEDIYLIPERQRLIGRLKRWIALRQTPPAQRRIAIVLYGFPLVTALQEQLPC